MLVLAIFAIAVLPQSVGAFWPFSSRADAATVGVMPSADTPALVAVTNPNPNSPAASPLPTSGDSALVPYQGPNGSPGDSIFTPATDKISTYVVRDGDSLGEIAEMFDVSVNTIVWANSLKNAKDVHPGDTLIILPVSGVSHIIAKGDSLKSLAKKYGGDADEIASYNGLDSSNALAVGSTIIIPGGEVAAPAKVPAKKRVKAPSGGGSSDGGGPSIGGWVNPLPGGLLWQGIHGANGVDIADRSGAPIYSAAGGTITIAKNRGWNGGYGNYVVISHTNGTQTLYAHMTNAVVAPGQTVNGGQLIGYVGASGKATGPHLHFEVRGAANPFRNCSIKNACGLR